MSSEEILQTLAVLNMVAWLLAAMAGYYLIQKTSNKGWVWITLGTMLVVGRQMVKLLPSYTEAKTSEVLFNVYMDRYVLGAAGGVMLCIGFVKLIGNYYKIREEGADV